MYFLLSTTPDVFQLPVMYYSFLSLLQQSARIIHIILGLRVSRYSLSTDFTYVLTYSMEQSPS